MKNAFGKDAQGAIEYLLIIGAAILVVAIVILAVTGVLSGGQGNVSSGVTSVTDSFDAMKEASGNYIKLDGQYYMKSDPLVSGLGGLWHFNDSNVDSGGSGKSLSFVAPQAGFGYSPGLFGSAFYNDGTNTSGYLASSPAAISLDSGRGFTVSAWVKAAPYTGASEQGCDAGIVSSWFTNVWYNSSPTWSLSQCIYVNLNKAVLYATDGSVQPDLSVKPPYYPPQLILASTSVIRNDKWHNVVMTLSTGTNSFAGLYVDGVLENSADPKTFFPGNVKTDTLYVSAKQHVNNSTSFAGQIDELAVWNRALSGDEIKKLFDSAVNAGK